MNSLLQLFIDRPPLSPVLIVGRVVNVENQEEHHENRGGFFEPSHQRAEEHNRKRREKQTHFLVCLEAWHDCNETTCCYWETLELENSYESRCDTWGWILRSKRQTANTRRGRKENSK